jgi:esterase/lipase superfamily enzyme
LYDGADGLGLPILFTWPSDGTAAGYLPDREDARMSAPQIADLFVTLHEHLITMQRAAAINKVRNGSAEGRNQTTVCTAKISVIAHSMGNYVMQNALAIASKKLNNPQLVSLIHQLVMVAADVDNDLFQKDKPADYDGTLMANVCYRISAFYSGLD